MSTRSNSNAAINTPYKIARINRSTTCVDIFDSTEIDYACDFCKNKLDPLKMQRKKKVDDNSNKKYCEKLWEGHHANHRKIRHIKRHMKVCNYLSMPYGIDIVGEYVYRKSIQGIKDRIIEVNTNSTSYAMSSPSISHTNTSESKNSNSSSNTYTRKKRKRKETPGYITILESEYEMLKESHRIVCKINDIINNYENFSWCTSPLSRQFLGLGIILIPTLSYFGAVKLYILF